MTLNLVIMDDSARRPAHYLGMGGVGAWFGVGRKTVAQWKLRYAETHPIPVPDVEIEGLEGWAPDRELEWRTWHATRVGQGKGGGPKPRRSSGVTPGE